ncbi:hypothetical protein BGZ88_011755 [Linnemannia elongata]|nr:hypothetical protein BGZ88_011755 [Linnemannia elongata]
MVFVPKQKRDKIYTAILEWLIGELIPFSNLDSDLFGAMVKAYIPNIDPLCSPAIRALLLDHRVKLREQLKDLLNRTLIYGAIAVDSWTSRSNKSYLEITGPDGWNTLSLIVSVTSDSASVIVKAAEIAGLNPVA